MKRKFLISCAVFSLFMASPSYAAWQDDFNTALKDADTAKLGEILVAHPDEAEALTLTILKEVSALIASNPEAALSLYEIAVANAGMIVEPGASEAITIISGILDVINSPDFQTAHPQESARFLDSTLSIVGKISSDQAPKLYEKAISSAESFLATTTTTTEPDKTVTALREHVTKIKEQATPPKKTDTTEKTKTEVPSAD